jgi:hypothetical protein
MINTIRSYAPQKVFLVQGDDSTYDQLLASTIVEDPFVYSLSVPRLTMDHARGIVSFIAEGTGESRTYLIYFSMFSPEAAQVLLKSLEEPDLDTTIIFVTPHPYTVPATIRSRVMIINGAIDTPVLPFKTRSEALALIKEEFGSDADDDAATKRARAVALLDALEIHLRQKPDAVRVVYEAKKMLFTANLPTKFVLEYAVSMAM